MTNFLASTANMTQISRFVPLTCHCKRSQNKTSGNVLASFMNRCLTNEQWCAVLTSLHC